MADFQVIPKLDPVKSTTTIYGVGINDADYLTEYLLNGIKYKCAAYQAWVNMLNYCYSKTYKHSGYTVADEWLTFSNFRKWYLSQDTNGLSLTARMVYPNNTVYCPEYCAFINGDIQRLIYVKPKKSTLPIGVNKHPKGFTSRLNINGKREYLGKFKTPEDARSAYIKAKSNHVKEVAELQKNNVLKRGLLRIADAIASGAYYG